jgi:hypothetical protein
MASQPQQPKAEPTGPIGYEGKRNNVFGTLNTWTRNMPFVQFIMFIFGWFTVPIEVFFRKNFGERWLTTVNFYAGLIVLTIFTMVQTFGSAMGSSSYMYNPHEQQQSEPSFLDKLMDKSMLIILLAYILISSYHFFKIWWQNRTDTPIHSFDDGTSRFELPATYLMKAINIIAVPMIRLYIRFLPKEEQQPGMPIPPLVDDVSAFTNTVVEPLLLLILFFFFHGVTATWLLLSSAALVLYSNWKEEAKLDRVLDLRDSTIAAANAKARRGKPVGQGANSMQNLIMQQVAKKIEKQPEIAAQIAPAYPDLMSVIEEMNK